MELLTSELAGSGMKMTSREIAELCSKEHRHVLRDVDDLNATYADMALPKVGQSNYVADNGQNYRQFLLSKEQTIDLITGYRADIRIRINRRWAELEAQAAKPMVPQTLPEALRLAADLAEQNAEQQERLALAEPKAAALDEIAAAEGSLNARDTAKTLGIKPGKFNTWAIKHNWMYRDSQERLQPHSDRIQQGYMTMRPVTYKGRNGDKKATTQAMFTPRGLVRLAEIFAIVKEVA